MTEDKAPLWARDSGITTTTQKANLGELLVMTSFVLYCIRFTFDYSSLLTRIDLLNSLIVVLNIVLPLIKIIFLQRYSLKRAILTAAIAVVVVYSSIISVNNHFLTGFLVLLAMQDIELDRIVRLGFRLKVASIAIHVVIYIFTFIFDPAAIQFVFRAGVGEARHYFFMGHANVFSAFLLWASLEYIFLRYHKLKVLNILTIWIINLVFYYFTISNTGIVVLALVTILIALDKLGRGFFDKLLTVLSKYLYAICAVVFSGLAMVYTHLSPAQKDVWHILDNAVTGRIWFGAYTYDVFGATLLGRRLRVPPVVFWQNRYFDGVVYFDNHYIGNLVRFGLINTILFAIVFIVIGRKAESKDKILIIAFAIFAIMQNDITNIVICSVMLIIGKYLYLDNSRVVHGSEDGRNDPQHEARGSDN